LAKLRESAVYSVAARHHRHDMSAAQGFVGPGGK